VPAAPRRRVFAGILGKATKQTQAIRAQIGNFLAPPLVPDAAWR